MGSALFRLSILEYGKSHYHTNATFLKKHQCNLSPGWAFCRPGWARAKGFSKPNLSYQLVIITIKQK